MGETSIEWTDKSWNPTRGCRRISPGCENCYAETMAARFCAEGQPFEGLIQLGKQGPRWNGAGRFVPDKLDEPLRWRKPARVFVNSMSDLFFDEFSDWEIAAVFGVMARAWWHTFQILTKRPERAVRWFRWWREAGLSHAGGGGVYGDALAAAQAVKGHSFTVWSGPKSPRHETMISPGWPLPNVHIGVSVENQHYADERIPMLLQIPAAVRFISYEPALGPINLDLGRCDSHDRDHIRTQDGEEFCNECAAEGWSGELTFGHWLDACASPTQPGINWVIVGGESGNSARPFDIAWARSAVQQCKAAGVACFVKQLGARPVDTSPLPVDPAATPIMQELLDGCNRGIAERALAKIKHKKGAAMEEWPADLRVREIPSAA